MITCSKCGTHYPHGSLVCHKDGELLVSVPEEPEKALALHESARRELATTGASFILIVEEADGCLFEGPLPEFTVPFSVFHGAPLRIGRADRQASPPIIPAIDLTLFLNDEKRAPISRLHAALELRNGSVHLRSVSRNSPTFHRRTGESRARALPEKEYVELRHRDVIYLAEPDARHVRLRVIIPH